MFACVPFILNVHFVWRHGLIASSDYILLHPISGHNQANDHLPEVMFFCAVISAVWNLVKGHNAVFFIQPSRFVRSLSLIDTVPEGKDTPLIESSALLLPQMYLRPNRVLALLE